MRSKKRSFSEMSSSDRRKLYKERKRIHILKKRFSTLMFTMILLVSSVVCLNVFNTKAKSSNSDLVLYKYYKNVQIQSDDTLWELAQENYCKEKQTLIDYIEEVKNINHLENDSIVAGNYIVLPYYSQSYIYITN